MFGIGTLVASVLKKRHYARVRFGGDRAKLDHVKEASFSASSRETCVDPALPDVMLGTVTLRIRSEGGREVQMLMSPDVAAILLDDLAARLGWCVKHSAGDRLPDVEALNAARSALAKHTDTHEGDRAGICIPLACATCDAGTRLVADLESAGVRR